jgi:hypothetical protein
VLLAVLHCFSLSCGSATVAHMACTRMEDARQMLVNGQHIVRPSRESRAVLLQVTARSESDRSRSGTLRVERSGSTPSGGGTWTRPPEDCAVSMFQTSSHRVPPLSLEPKRWAHALALLTEAIACQNTCRYKCGRDTWQTLHLRQHYQGCHKGRQLQSSSQNRERQHLYQSWHSACVLLIACRGTHETDIAVTTAANDNSETCNPLQLRHPLGSSGC